ncbi:MAG: hypothetical protein JXB14_04235 [Candidatus Altiarchaeota archaeon]|nr:hypothetical protein [Candidatus Altiarchaeota archaeon]
MAHIRKKTIKGKTYLYLYETCREDGRVKSVYLRYLGPERVFEKYKNRA